MSKEDVRVGILGAADAQELNGGADGGGRKPPRKRRRAKPDAADAFASVGSGISSAPGDDTGVPEWLRNCFELRANGLFKKTPDDKADIWLCAPLHIEAETRDEGGEGWGLLLSWRDRDGRNHRQAFPRILFAGECAELRARLADGGLSMNGWQTARQALGEYLNVATSSQRARSTGRIGWHWIGDRPVFLLPDTAYGEAPEVVVLQGEDRQPSLFGVAGDLAAWRQEIGLRCGSNSRLLFAASCGFAAPLLGLNNQTGIGFNFRGKSQSGKSTLLRVAASVCGGTAKDGAVGYWRSWHSTANGVESIAANSNDSLLALDELGQLDPKVAADVAYMLANGAGKNRASRTGGGRPAARWRLIFLSTGETGLEDRIAEAGKRMQAGQEVRLLDIPADAGARLGCFEELHGEASGDEFARLLAGSTAGLYGTPLRAFLAYLTNAMRGGSALYLDGLRDRAAALAAELLKGNEDAGGQVRSIAARFAIVGLAGEMATEAMITPWRPGEAAAAARTCFLAYLAERGTLGAREDAQAAAQLRAFISRNGEARFTRWIDHEPASCDMAESDPAPPGEGIRTQNRAGFRRWVKRPDGTMAWRYFLTREGMAEAMAGLAPREATKTLATAGLLVPSAAAADLQRGVLAGVYSVPAVGKVRLYRVADDVLGLDAAE